MRREKMEIVAIDLLLLSTLDAVAMKNQISSATLYHLRKTSAFMDLLTEQKRRLFSEASAKMQSYTLEAVETLVDIMRSDTAQDANKINAIRILLDQGKGAYEREVIWPQLEELEKKMDSIERGKRT